MKKRRRTRYDRASVVVPRNVPEQTLSDKPTGLWYSVDRDWERWCGQEQPDWLVNKHLHDVTLGKEKMIRIGSVIELDAFHEEYKAAFTREHFWINWQAVAKNYDGIEIAPYVWERRLQGNASRWYYTWDCASGCVWRPKGMRLRLVKAGAVNA